MSRSRLNARRLGAALAVIAAFAIPTALMPSASAQTVPDQPPAVVDQLAKGAQPAATAPPTSYPEPASPPASSSAGGEAPLRAGTLHRAAFYHLDLEPVAVQSLTVGSDTVVCYTPQTHVGCTQPKTAPLAGDLLRWAGNARWLFNRHLGLHYQRIAHLGVAGRTNGKYGGSGYDYEELESFEWTFNPVLVMNVGWDYRATVCCPGAGDPTNPTPRAKHGPFISMGWRFGPTTVVGKPFALSLRTTFVDHEFNAAAQSGLARGVTDIGRKNEYVPTLYWNIPIYHQNRFVPFLGWEYYTTFFDNRPTLSYTNRKVFGLAMRLTNDFSVRIIDKNDQNWNVGPDGTHKAYMQVEAAYRIRK